MSSLPPGIGEESPSLKLVMQHLQGLATNVEFAISCVLAIPKMEESFKDMEAMLHACEANANATHEMWMTLEKYKMNVQVLRKVASEIPPPARYQ